jgi:hypothetical protein
MRTSTCAKAVPERSHHARVEQHGVADLVAGGIAQPERVPDGERREVERAVQRLQVVRVTDGRGAQEGHAAGTGAHLDDRDDRPRVDVARSLPARRPLDRPAEPEKRAPQLGACAPVLVRGIRPVHGVQAVDHHPDGRPLGPPSASRHQGSAREKERVEPLGVADGLGTPPHDRHGIGPVVARRASQAFTSDPSIASPVRIAPSVRRRRRPRPTAAPRGSGIECLLEHPVGRAVQCQRHPGETRSRRIIDLQFERSRHQSLLRSDREEPRRGDGRGQARRRAPRRWRRSSAPCIGRENPSRCGVGPSRGRRGGSVFSAGGRRFVGGTRPATDRNWWVGGPVEVVQETPDGRRGRGPRVRPPA